MNGATHRRCHAPKARRGRRIVGENRTSARRGGARGGNTSDEECELILVLGGDGTILHAAELGRPAGVPILGINYGHVGFLSEADPVDAPQVVRQIAERSWGVDSRMTIDVTIVCPDGKVKRDWALNEVAIEKDADFRMLEVSIGVDGREISAFKVDTVLFSTATGSTAYNFSGGGPIVWPDVEGPHARGGARIVHPASRGGAALAARTACPRRGRARVVRRTARAERRCGLDDHRRQGRASRAPRPAQRHSVLGKARDEIQTAGARMARSRAGRRP